MPQNDRVQAHILVCFFSCVHWKARQQWQRRAGSATPLPDESWKLGELCDARFPDRDGGVLSGGGSSRRSGVMWPGSSEPLKHICLSSSSKPLHRQAGASVLGNRSHSPDAQPSKTTAPLQTTISASLE